MDPDAKSTQGLVPKRLRGAQSVAGGGEGRAIHYWAPHGRVTLLLSAKPASNRLQPGFQKDDFHSQARILRGGGTSCFYTKRRTLCSWLF